VKRCESGSDSPLPSGQAGVEEPDVPVGLGQ
jgi:hypothetical protein